MQSRLQGDADRSALVQRLAALQRLADQGAAPGLQRVAQVAAAAPASTTLQAVELEDLMMQSQALAALNAQLAVTWTPLADRLAAFANGDGAKLLNGGLIDFPHMLVGSDAGKLTHAPMGKSSIPEDLIDLCHGFLFNFMSANGQLAYIQEQEWFQAGTHRVVVEVNYYHERQFVENSKTLGLHKDTDSRNLFVNLVFNNPTPIPATEWILDPYEPDDKRLEELRAYLPDSEFQKIAALKMKLRDELAEAEKPGDKDKAAPREGLTRFEGGATPAQSYVSWVDEMVWHATPATQPRPKYDPAATAEMVNGGVAWVKQQVANAINGLVRRDIQAEIRRAAQQKQQEGKVLDVAAYRDLLVKKHGQRLFTEYRDQKAGDYFEHYFGQHYEVALLSVRGLEPVPESLVKPLSSAEDWAAYLRAQGAGSGIEITDGAKTVAWDQEPVSGEVGMVVRRVRTDKTPKDDPGKATDIAVPTKVGRRRRANSLDPGAIRAVVEAIAAMKAGKTELPKRSFIRTWVTLVPNAKKDD